MKLKFPKKIRKRLPSIKYLKTKADAAFSLFIRRRDEYKCVLCGATQRDSSIQCGHLIKRGKMATRYDEVNCHALCSACNYKDNFEPQHYVSWFIKQFGSKSYQKLVELSRQIKQMKRCDFEEIINKYENL